MKKIDAIEAKYYPMTQRIEAAAIMSDDPTVINAFIDRLNIDVDYEHSGQVNGIPNF
ncbi:MAG: hypothetical protein LBS12_04075 [Prevotellaceae bacterium]|jgi:hypothetical protein|nr:hypothetical protein [Prevotellaceae bacterium]